MENSKRKLVSRVLVIAIALSMIIPAGAFIFSTDTIASSEDTTPEAAHSTTIRLQRATFDTNIGEPELPANLRVESYTDTWYNPYLVQCDGPITEEWKNSLRQSGAEIVSYIPDNALLVRVPQPNVEKMNGIPGVCWSGIYQPAYKINPRLDGVTGTIPLEISFFLEGTNGPTVRLLQDHDVEVISIASSDKVNKIIVKADASLISEIANFADVKWISDYSQPKPMNDSTVPLLQSGVFAGARPVHAQGIEGLDEVVTISDSGINVGHQNFQGSVYTSSGDQPKILANYIPPTVNPEVELGDYGSFHGSHTSGTASGDGPAYGTWQASTYDGHAFMDQLVMQDIGDQEDPGFVFPPADYYKYLFEDAEALGSKIHSNSWGGGEGYGDDSVQIDSYIWDSKDFTICFA
ncbi:MAG: hypothetical protein KAX31_01355, partial [Thermoplasmata archaeon]|nr:hypothetical protein [Thermoplasmata archaeon]